MCFHVNHRTKMGHGFQFANCHKLPEAFPTKVSLDGQLVIVELPSRIPNWEPDFHNVGESTHVLGHRPIWGIRDGTKPRKMTRRTHRFCYIHCIYIYIYVYIVIIYYLSCIYGMPIYSHCSLIQPEADTTSPTNSWSQGQVHALQCRRAPHSVKPMCGKVGICGDLAGLFRYQKKMWYLVIPSGNLT